MSFLAVINIIAVLLLIVLGIYTWKLYHTLKARPIFWLMLACFYGIVIRTVSLLVCLELVSAPTKELMVPFYILLAVGIIMLYRVVKGVLR